MEGTVNTPFHYKLMIQCRVICTSVEISIDFSWKKTPVFSLENDLRCLSLHNTYLQ